MGKITVTGNPKKEREDVVGLVTPRKDKKPPATNPEPQHQQPPSPTPNHPVNRTKLGCCCRIFLLFVSIFVVFILFAVIACFIDYQQGNITIHSTKVSKELKDKSKYMIEVLFQTPSDLQRLFEKGRLYIENGSKVNETLPTNNSGVNNNNNKTMGDRENIDGDVLFGLQELRQFVAGVVYDFGNIFVSEIENQLDDFPNSSNKDSYSTINTELVEDDDVILPSEQFGKNGDLLESNLKDDDREEEAIETIEEVFTDETGKTLATSYKDEFLDEASLEHTH